MKIKTDILRSKKFLVGGALLIIALVFFLNSGGKKETKMSDDAIYKSTINISRSYLALRVQTDKILKEASSYPDYQTWNTDMSGVISHWKYLEEKAAALETQADRLSREKVSFKLVNEACAYSKEEISNVFDKAPAGKKIKTLAKFLGVDAKRAFKILKSDQEFVKADAWNEAGDTFKKLETSAVVIKDGCKVAGFIGAAAMTGGAAAGATLGTAGVGTALVGGSATVFEGTVMVVTGTDLLLEVGEDTATIALGDNHKGVKAISDIRSVTDPAASLLSLTDIPKNISKGAEVLDKVGVVLMQVDQIRSMLQDGKLLGINIKPDSKVEVAPLKKDEVDKWLEENTKENGEESAFDDWIDNFDDLSDWLDSFEVETKNDTDNNEEETEVKTKVEDEKQAEKENVKDEGDSRVYSQDGKVSAWIVSPEGELSSGGTQLWEVKVDGYDYKGENRGYECYWDFYTEYKEGVKPWMNLKSCKSTHGVPGKDIFVGDPPGSLRVVVRVNLLKQNYSTDEFGNRVQDGKKIAETLTLEKTYVVAPYYQ